MRRNLYLLLFCLLFTDSLFPQTAYFYKGRDYGSEAVYNPVTLILNGGFDMIQVERSRDIRKLPIGQGINNVLKNLGDPFTPVRNYGFWNFVKDQVLPFSVDKRDAQYWPNYTLHLIGGGMSYAAMKEWYEYHNYPAPAALSIATMAAYHIINEAVENGAYEGDNVDPIADVYLFNVGGIILFSSESVKKFFSEKLNLADWSLQPSFCLRTTELHNNGQFFSIKWKLPFFDKWHLFYYFGTNGVGGLSYKYDDGSALSVGLGMAVSELFTVNSSTNKKTVDLVWNVGVFYDRNNSLLASLSLTKKTDYMANLNIYPGVVKIGDFSPGIWMAYTNKDKFIMGITARWAPFGLAYKSK